MSDVVSQAVIMVGGKGTRLKPLTDNWPKPLLPVLGIPCVEYVIRRLVESGVDEIILACGYRSEDMVRIIGNGERFGIKIDYSYESEPAGTVGSIKLLQGRLQDTFLVASGDVLADVDIKGMIQTHFEHEAYVTMALTTVERPTEFGIVGLDSEGRIERFKEKPLLDEVFSNLINAGIYVLQKRALDFVPEGRPYDFSKDLFPDLMSKGLRLQGHVLSGFWKDIGRPTDLREANIFMAKTMENGPFMGLSSVVDSDISTDSAVMSGCLIIGSQIQASVIQEKVNLLDSRIYSSLIFSEVTVDRNSCISGSIIGYRCRIGMGVKISDSVIADGQVVPDGSELISCKMGVPDEH